MRTRTRSEVGGWSVTRMLCGCILGCWLAAAAAVEVFLVETSSDDAVPVPYTSSGQSIGAACAQGSKCVPVTSCRMVRELMDTACLAGGKLGSLTCGYVGSEVMVCCPLAGMDGIKPTPSPGSVGGGGQGGTAFGGQCGQPLVGGTSIGSQPWVARVGYASVLTGKLSYPCCGSIISRRTILTAAHCALAKSDGHKLSSVQVGEYDGRGDPDCTRSYCAHPMQVIPVSHVVVHPGYEREQFKHDVALLVLKYDINYTMTAQPVCILQNPKVPLVGRRGRLVGWGKLPGQDVTPSRQQQLELPIVQLELCSALYSSVIPVTGQQLCVGGEAGKDACSGFGGSPLVLLDHLTHRQYYQVAMASFGSDRCGAAGVPSVYTNVQKYAEWIKNNMT